MKTIAVLAVAVVSIVLISSVSIFQAFAGQFAGCTGNPHKESHNLGEAPTGNPHDSIPGVPDTGNPHDASLDGVEGFDSQCHGTHGGP